MFVLRFDLVDLMTRLCRQKNCLTIPTLNPFIVLNARKTLSVKLDQLTNNRGNDDFVMIKRLTLDPYFCLSPLFCANHLRTD